jgi:hypothetical protein
MLAIHNQLLSFFIIYSCCYAVISLKRLINCCGELRKSIINERLAVFSVPQAKSKIDSAVIRKK